MEEEVKQGCRNGGDQAGRTEEQKEIKQEGEEGWRGGLTGRSR